MLIRNPGPVKAQSLRKLKQEYTADQTKIHLAVKCGVSDAASKISALSSTADLQILKAAVRTHLDVLSSRLKVPSSLNHCSRGLVCRPQGIAVPLLRVPSICQCPCSTAMKCNAPDVVSTLPSTEGHTIISPLLGSGLR